MIRIDLEKNRVQWTDYEGAHYVGRALIDDELVRIHDWQNGGLVAVQRDYDGGLWFVEQDRLRTYPDAPIPEPTNTGEAR